MPEDPAGAYFAWYTQWRTGPAQADVDKGEQHALLWTALPEQHAVDSAARGVRGNAVGPGGSSPARTVRLPQCAEPLGRGEPLTDAVVLGQRLAGGVDQIDADHLV